MGPVRFLNSGDSGISIEFGNEISPEINSRVKNLSDSLKKKPINGITEVIPSFRALLVCYDPLTIRYNSLIKKLKVRLKNSTEELQNSRKIFVIPVCYGGELGDDLKDVCSHTGLSEAEVVKLHSSNDYLVYMLGFLPGFAYLGGMDARLNTPRLDNPRTIIPAGSVGIGGSQTGIYPLASPGGWRLIGRTPLKPYDPDRKPPILFSSGDYIRFQPIDTDEFRTIEEMISQDTYLYNVLSGGDV